MRLMLFAPRTKRSASAAATVMTSSARTLARDNDELLVRRDGARGNGIAQREDVASAALPRKTARVVVEDGGGAPRIAVNQAKPHAVVDAGEEVRLPARRARVEGEGAAEVAASLRDAAEDVVADAELRRGHVGDAAQRR